MTKIKISLLMALLLLLSWNSYGEINKVQIDKAVSVAEQAAIEHGYDIKEMGMMLQVNELPQFMYEDERGKFPESGPKYELLKLLKGKDYVSIYYKPHGGHPGYVNDVCIIIDARDWESILSIYESQKQ